jgi:hypothetical protein
MAKKKIEVLYHPYNSGTPGEPFKVPAGTNPEYYINKGYTEKPCDMDEVDEYVGAITVGPVIHDFTRKGKGKGKSK